MADLGAEFLFQVIAERAEKATVILTTNLPFSEWTQVIPTLACARRCWTASPIGRTSSNRRRQLPLQAHCRERQDQDHGLIDARAVLRAFATLQPRAQRISIPLPCPASCHRWAELTATSGPRLLAKPRVDAEDARILVETVMLYC